MAQWGQGQPGYQYPLQTGFPGQFQPQNNPQFQPQNQQFQPQNQPSLLPQQTGFPQRPPFPQQTGGFQHQQTGNFLQPQATGFVGSNFAGRPAPPPPPVPAIPSQFQSNQPSFLNAPPPIPQRTLLPQQTGFPGQTPLVPQVTGFVDPRLQMMSNTFMPANTSSPYGAGGAPLLQSQPSVPLQQSFQQHNAQRGSAAPRIPWALSKSEKKSYDNIFRAWDVKGTGFINGQTALEVFGQSGLSKDDLARIWGLADTEDRGKLNIAEFHVAMGLIYRKLNGNEIPDQLPPELVPPSSRDLESYNDFVKDLLKNDTRVRSPSSLDAPVSRLKDRSFNSSESVLAGRDATIYKHDDNTNEKTNYYSPRSRHIDREAIRTRSDRDNPESDLKDLKNMLSNTQAMLDKAAADDASRTAEDEALDRELDELKYRVKRIQDDLDYYSRPPRSAEKDREKRALERDLLNIMHERIPEVERRLKAREERKEREKRQWARDRDRANERFGRYNDRDADRYSSRYDDERDRPYSRGSYRDDRDRDYDRDRDSPYERDRDYRRRSPSRDRDYGRDRPRSPVGRDAPPPPPPPSQPVPEIRSPPPAPKPSASPAPNLKNMTPEERQAYARAEAQRRIEARKAALGLVATPSPAPDVSVEDRLQQERKEAEEKARVAEKEAEERENLRRERLERERSAKEEFNAPPPAPTPTKTASAPPSTPTAKPAPPAAKTAPPPPKPRVPPAAPPPRSTKAAVPRAVPAPSPAPAPPPPPAEPEVDPEEEAFRAKQEALKKQREARAARLKALEEEARREEEEQKREEERYNQRIQAARVKSTPSPAPPPPIAVSSPPPPPPPPAVSSPPVKSPPALSPGAERSKTNPFAKLMDQATVSPPSASNGSTNPWDTAAAIEKPPAAAAASPASPAPPAPAFNPTPAGPPPVRTPYHTAASTTDTEDWEDVKEVEDGSDSEDEFQASRGARANLASKLFSGILGGGSTPPSATPTPPPTSAPTAPPPPAPPAPTDGGAPPPPPPPPVAASAPSTSAGSGDRSALFASIQGGQKLRSVKTVDKSGPPVSGKVLGDSAPPAHITSVARPPSPPVQQQQQQLPPPSNKRESVDWYAGLASETSSPTVERMESVPEEEPEPVSASTDIPNIEITAPDLMADIDKSAEYPVRTLYAFEGEGDDDLSFAENLILTANPSKSGGEWWYGKIASTGKAGLFPKAYVQPIVQTKAVAKFSYNADKEDELSFVEGDTLTIIEQNEGDWWMAEQGGMVFLVPASYLETTEDVANISAPDADQADYYPEIPRHDTTEQDTEPLEDDSPESDNSDSDSEDDGPENEAEREARAHERQLVLEAAGLIVKKDVQPPPRPMRKKTGSKRPPAPAAPQHKHKHSHSYSKDLPPVPEPEPLDPTAHIDDAFDRYESFRQTQTNRLSTASLESASSPTASVSTSVTSVKEGAYSQLKNFLGRNKTPVEHEKRTMPVISAPILAPQPEDRTQSPAFGSSWSSLVDKSALEGIPPNERKRQETIFELIATESAYVRDLQLIVEVFYSSMMPLLDQKGTTVVFANIEDILLTNTTFLSSLEERQKECRLYIDRIGDILHSQMANMNVYMEYCVNQSNATTVLKTLRDSRPELASHLQRLRDDPTTRNLDLSSFLLIPMQRITRYPLLIRQILHYTELGEEQKLIQDALGTAERILNRINETIREQEGHETLKRISQHLWVGQGRLDLTAPTRYMGPRRLLKEGHLMKAKSGRKLHAFLCSDILVLTDDAMKNLYRMPIALSEAQVKDLPGARDDLSFQITLPYPRGGDAIALRATSVRDCQLWMQAIESAGKKCRAAEKRALRKSGQL